VQECRKVDIKMLMLRQNNKERLQIKWRVLEVATDWVRSDFALSHSQNEDAQGFVFGRRRTWSMGTNLAVLFLGDVEHGPWAPI
jgi:hypothetical protein